MAKSSFFLKKHAFIYESIFDILITKHPVSDIKFGISKVKLLSNFAWFAHPGRFVDTRLDSLIAQIGQSVWDNTQRCNKEGYKCNQYAKRRVLHVASETYYTGGHTRLLLNLVKNDKSSSHSLVLTQQNIEEVPEWLATEIILSGGIIDSMKSKSIIEQIIFLQNKMCYNADKIFYHIHPDDSVAVAALAAVPRPQVMFINHADHVFCLGTSLVDIVVCYRKWSLQFSIANREAQRVMLLPTPIKAPSVSIDKSLAKIELKIPIDSIIILTVASYSKFIPSGEYNYFRTVKKILDKNPNVLLKIIGISPDDDLNKIEFEYHKQIELLGSIHNPQKYYEAADIYIDSMPFSSFTSLFEALYFQCYPILQYNPVDTLIVDSEPAIAKKVLHPEDEYEQLKFIQKAIDNPIYRNNTAKIMSDLVKHNYTGGGWVNILEELYSSTYDEVLEIKNSSKGLIKSKYLTITENDVDAANLAETLFGDSHYTLLRLLDLNNCSISFFEFFDLFFLLNSKKKEFGRIISLRDFAWLLRRKILRS